MTASGIASSSSPNTSLCTRNRPGGACYFAGVEPADRHRLRVMLVDDHEVVRKGIRSLLEAHDDIVVVAEAGSVRDALVQARGTKPDVVVMDVVLGDGSGIEATRQIRADRPQTQVIVLTSFADEDALFALILAGAAGYVLKEIRAGDLVSAIRTVGEG